MTDERDDDDTPNVRDDNAKHPMVYASATARAVGPDFFRAFKAANSGNPREEVRGLVEMMVLNIREGEMPGRDFVPLPVHLPDDERGMRLLAMSKVAADADLKRELLAWASGNRDLHDRAAKALENAVGAYRKADVILADENCTDEELGTWCEIIVNHCLHVWKVNIREAPMDPKDIAVWAREACGRFNITPEFLHTGGKTPTTFDPTEHRRGGPAHNPMRAFRAHGGGDD